jgi:hypothetical protein
VKVKFIVVARYYLDPHYLSHSGSISLSNATFGSGNSRWWHFSFSATRNGGIYGGKQRVVVTNVT